MNALPLNVFRKSPVIAVLVCALLSALPHDARAQSLSEDRRTVLDALAEGVPVSDRTPLSSEESQALYDKAEAYLERYQANHLPHGLNADIVWSDRDRSQVDQYTGLGDSALFTGFYVASLALRYALEPADDTVQSIHEALDRIELLTEVSGRTGYVARYAGPADDEFYEPYYQIYGSRLSALTPGPGSHAHYGASPYHDLIWLGNSSRDTYDGLHFAFAALWVYVDEPAVRDRVKFLVERVGTRLNRDLFFVWDGRRGLTRPTYLWRLAWLTLMQTVNPDRFSGLWVRFQARYSYGIYRILGVRTLSVSTRRYYPNNLRMARLFTLSVLETGPGRREAYLRTLRALYHGEFRSHLNAHFSAIYLLCTGDSDPSAIATVQGALLDFPEEKWLDPVDNRNRFEDRLVDDRHIDRALLPSERVPSDFLWQRAPGQVHSDRDANVEFPGIDMLLPYWMGRVAGVIEPPPAP